MTPCAVRRLNAWCGSTPTAPHCSRGRILEFPQSGERFEGLDNFREWRDQYPAQVTARIRRISGSAEVRVGELSASYDGGPRMLGISVHEFRGERLAREGSTSPSHGMARVASAMARRHRRKLTDLPRPLSISAAPTIGRVRPVGRRMCRST